MQKSAKVEIRVTPAETAAWAEAAGGSRKVSAWLRALANQAAFAKKREALPEGIDPPYEAHARALDIPVLDAVSPGEVGKVSIGKTNGVTLKCPRAHHHRPGVYCGTCKKIN